ncbi:MBL fold hydrolase [Desulfoluna limicola]|uniref:MBL fold hydrolase n=1 Tax=Desulfoluna limicola TaxID=2810562 RepID=A0ABM7PLK6_9BACT|nr:MBL fold metallo-hydrolase [Desulfoluna limicola]BCS98266.1 MBL fold hydrolase [Desulfoluna limicola]
MGRIETLQHDTVRGARVGRFNLGLTTTTLVWRIGTTLVDTGPPNQWKAVKSFMDEEAVKQVVVTHHHEDHSGNASRVIRERALPLFATQKAATHLIRGHSLKPYQRVVWGRSATCAPTVLDGPLDAGDGYTLTPVPCPGHSEDHTCFLEEQEGWLFSGDLYIADAPVYFRADENLPETLATLEHIQELDFHTLFCAHRGVVTDGKEALKRKHAYLTRLRKEAQTLSTQGLSINTITRRLLGVDDATSYATGFHFCKANLIRACLNG